MEEQDRGNGEPQRVIVTDIDLPFWSVVGLMIQWAIASIPAVIILMIVIFLAGAVMPILLIGGS